MDTHAKRKLKYSRNENFNLLHYVKWDRIVTLTGALVSGHEGYVIVSITKSKRSSSFSFIRVGLFWSVINSGASPNRQEASLRQNIQNKVCTVKTIYTLCTLNLYAV